MKALVVGFAIATLTTASWKPIHNDSVVPKTSATRHQTAASNALQGRFDLSKLPRALELPLIDTPLQPGDMAPDFELPDQNGVRHRLSKMRGQTVVLSFYPRDLTYVCAYEALNFDDNMAAFRQRGAMVFSISVQDVPSKAQFASRYNISHPLLADTSKSTASRYHVLSKDGVAGRVTFVIDPYGRIQWTSQKVNASTHAMDVLAVLDQTPKSIWLKT